MKKILIMGVVGIVVLAANGSAFAQSGRTWRCPGNLYTNDPAEAKQLGGCELIKNKLTIISGKDAARPTGGKAPAGVSKAAPAPSEMRISTGTQTSRDKDARQMLETELSKKQTELAVLQGQYNNGEPARLLSEANNEPAYQDRVTRISQEIERKVADISDLQKELSRLH